MVTSSLVGPPSASKITLTVLRVSFPGPADRRVIGDPHKATPSPLQRPRPCEAARATRRAGFGTQLHPRPALVDKGSPELYCGDGLGHLGAHRVFRGGVKRRKDDPRLEASMVLRAPASTCGSARSASRGQNDGPE